MSLNVKTGSNRNSVGKAAGTCSNDAKRKQREGQQTHSSSYSSFPTESGRFHPVPRCSLRHAAGHPHHTQHGLSQPCTARRGFHTHVESHYLAFWCQAAKPALCGPGLAAHGCCRQQQRKTRQGIRKEIQSSVFLIFFFWSAPKFIPHNLTL